MPEELGLLLIVLVIVGGWLLTESWGAPKRRQDVAADAGAVPFYDLPPDCVLLVSSPAQITDEERMQLGASLTAQIRHRTRPLVVFVPQGLRVEAMIRATRPEKADGAPS